MTTTTTRNIDEVLAGLGIELPHPCQAAGNYRPAVLVGNLLYISGHTQDDARSTGFAVGKVWGSFKSADSNPAPTSPAPGKELGTVKWYNKTKGYGFIQPDAGGKDVFVHVSEVQRAGFAELSEGQKIEYAIRTEHGKSAAVDLATPGTVKTVSAPAGSVTPKQAYDAAHDIGLAILSSAKAALGDLNRIKRVVRATGVVNATPDFTEHPKVIDGFSDLMAQVLGAEHGVGARSATGVPSLPGGVAVEVTEVIFELHPEQ